MKILSYLKLLFKFKKAGLINKNAQNAKDVVDILFPNEKWKLIEKRIYLSVNRAIGKKTNFKAELRDAQILRDFGSTIYLVSEPNTNGKKYDAIVDGHIFEFKNIGGNTNTLEHQFLRSRSQAPNVFINLETSNLTKREILSTLFSARNKLNTEKSHGYIYYNNFNGGKIILKIKGHKNLICLNIDDLLR